MFGRTSRQNTKKLQFKSKYRFVAPTTILQQQVYHAAYFFVEVFLMYSGMLSNLMGYCSRYTRMFQCIVQHSKKRDTWYIMLFIVELHYWKEHYQLKWDLTVSQFSVAESDEPWTNTEQYLHVHYLLMKRAIDILPSSTWVSFATLCKLDPKIATSPLDISYDFVPTFQYSCSSKRDYHLSCVFVNMIGCPVIAISVVVDVTMWYHV